MPAWAASRSAEPFCDAPSRRVPGGSNVAATDNAAMSSLLRLHLPVPLSPGLHTALPEAAVRHVQVRRLQPGDRLAVFDGRGGEWSAQITAIGRRSAELHVGEPLPALPELPVAVTLAVGMPANERMDTLVEKATELGAARLQPLLTERAVLRLSGERAERRQAHWQSIAAAACEQCGRATVPVVEPVRTLADWLPEAAAAAAARWLLSPRLGGTAPAALPAQDAGGVVVLSGPEGGLADAEEAAAVSVGFRPVSLGPRVLRADTAPLAAMAWLALSAGR